jgi:hypothetical protein
VPHWGSYDEMNDRVRMPKGQIKRLNMSQINTCRMTQDAIATSGRVTILASTKQGMNGAMLGAMSGVMQ